MDDCYTRFNFTFNVIYKKIKNQKTDTRIYFFPVSVLQDIITYALPFLQFKFNYVTEKNIIHDTNKTESTTFYVQDI